MKACFSFCDCQEVDRNMNVVVIESTLTLYDLSRQSARYVRERPLLISVYIIIFLLGQVELITNKKSRR